MKTIEFNTFSPLNSIWKGRMFLLPTVLTLGNARVYVCTSDSSDIASYVKAPINQSFYMA